MPLHIHLPALLVFTHTHIYTYGVELSDVVFSLDQELTSNYNQKSQSILFHQNSILWFIPG